MMVAPPLRYYPDACEAAFRYVEAGFPIFITSGVSFGATGPVTTAGSTITNNAELLAGLVLVQLIRPGTGVIVANFAFPMDMKTAVPVFGSLSQLKEAISDAQNLGSSVIGLTGGEPLLRDDLEDIIAAIDQRSMPVLFTTGYKLTQARVKSLKKAGLEIPVISLDHYSAEIHDKGRRKEGIFA